LNVHNTRYMCEQTREAVLTGESERVPLLNRALFTQTSMVDKLISHDTAGMWSRTPCLVTVSRHTRWSDWAESCIPRLHEEAAWLARRAHDERTSHIELSLSRPVRTR